MTFTLQGNFKGRLTGFVALCLLAVFNINTGFAQSIFTNPITGTNPNTSNPYNTGQTIDANITASGIGRGSGLTTANANNRYNASAWTTGASVDVNDYFEFVITPAANYKINFVSFVYTGQVSSGTPNFAFRSSVDGFVSNIGTPTATGATISLSGASYQNITSAITFRFYAYTLAAGTTTYSINDFTFNGAVVANLSNTSNIITTPSFTYPVNLAYQLNQENSDLTNANSVEVAQFTIQDGGGANDADNLSTSLTAITFGISNNTLLRRVGIYDGGIEIAELPVSGNSISFSSLSGLSAPDNSSKIFSLRASFNSPVTDNQQFAFTVNSATANGSGSQFAAANAGGATTSVAGDNNKIEVTATNLVFGVSPSTVSINSIMSPSPTIIAKDGLGNTDLDYTGSVALTTTGTFAGGATTTVSAVSGTATFSNLLLSAEGTGITIEGSGIGSTGNSVAFDVTNPQPEINVKQGVTNILTGGSYSFGTQVSGTSTSAITFTVENTGSATLNLTGSPKILLGGADAGLFTVNQLATTASVTSLSSTTFTISFNPTSVGAKTASITIANNDADENPYAFSLNGTGTANAESDIITNTLYTSTANINYAGSQTLSGLNIGNSVGVHGFIIRDGAGGTDADNLSLNLTALSYLTNGSTAVRTAALFDGTTNIAEVAVNGATSFSFPGLSVTVADGGTKELELRVTFQSVVTDNQQVLYTINSASTNASGSSFAPFDPQGVFSSTTGDNNRLEVTASLLVFVQQPSSAATNVSMTPPVTVAANDANGNRDLDFTEQVRITSTGTLTGSPVDVSAVAGLATFSTLSHTVNGTGLSLNAERTTTLDWDVTSSTFNISSVSAASDYFRSNVAAGNWATAGSWQTSADGINNWITSTLIPGSGANQITIRNGHNITVNSATSADQIVIESGGILTHTSNLTIVNGTGDDITVQSGGTIIYATGPTYTASTIRINQGGILSIRGSGLTANNAGVNAATHIYDNGAILEWNFASATPSASGVTYFPGVNASTIPILRFTTTFSGSAGGGSNTVVNGKVEVASGVTINFTGAGTKTFRNGITGAGNVVQNASGQFIISGTTAEIGGTGALTLGAAGLLISSPAATLTSSKTFGGATATTSITGVLNLNGFALNVAGPITGAGTLSGSASSSLVTNAASTLRFTTNAQTLKDLSVTTGTTTLATPLSITGGTAANTYGTVTVSSGATLASNGNLNIKSNEFGTARVAAGAVAGNYITGDVTVERYIPANAKRAWRLLSVPTQGTKTIQQTWQENQAANANGVPGFGTIISANLGTAALLQAAGFDAYSQTTSIQSYNSGTQVWTYLTSTNGSPIETNKGYFIYIRGERTQGVSSATNVVTATTLRTTGTLYQGNSNPAISVAAGKYEPVGNTYASAIDFTSLTKTGGISNTFYMWDAKLLAGTSLGAYQTFSLSTGWVPATPGGSYPASPNTTIESGSAFMVTASGTAGTIALNEGSKTTGNQFNPYRPAAVHAQFRTSLYRAGATAVLADNNIVVFDNAYANVVDGDDAFKIAHAGENMDILTGNQSLIIDARKPVESTDVINFSMKNLTAQVYKLEFTTLNMNTAGLTAFVEDKYLHTTTEINLDATTEYSFAVDANTASKAADRFSVVFKKAKVLPVSNVKAITVSPNPVEGSVANVQFKNQAKGRYTINLLSNAGQVIYSIVAEHGGGTSTKLLNLPNGLAAGTYQLEVVSPYKTKQVQSILINTSK